MKRQQSVAIESLRLRVQIEVVLFLRAFHLFLFLFSTRSLDLATKPTTKLTDLHRPQQETILVFLAHVLSELTQDLISFLRPLLLSKNRSEPEHSNKFL